MKKFSLVALVEINNREQGIPMAIKLLGTNPVSGKTVALKPNFNTADPFPASTHDDTLKTLVLELYKMGAKNITVAERCGPGNTQAIMEEKRTFEIGREVGFDVVNLEDAGPKAWVHLNPRNTHWSGGYHFARIFLDTECVVTTCCLKTHSYGGHFTMSLKLSTGMLPRTGYPYMGELHSSPRQRSLIAEMNVPYSPALVLLDGIEAFTHGGPMTGTREHSGIILAGDDRIAVDAVGVAMLRKLGTTPEVSRGRIFAQEQIARAVELELGVSSPEQIEIVTGDPPSKKLADELKQILLS